MQVIGADVGENSLGLASIEFDNSGTPIAINRLMAVLHDNGRDGMASGSGGSVSRKASGGVARRVRRLYRNRRKRRLKLEEYLSSHDYPITPPESLETYDEWRVRYSLIHQFVDDESSRKKQLAIAIRHMSNHRGWANAWVRLDAYLWNDEPTPEFHAAVEELVSSDRFDFETDAEDIRFQADLAAFGLRRDERLRPRTPSNPGIDAVPLEQGNLLGSQRRIDVVREWREICRVQEVSDQEFEALARIAFSQELPSVPIERVGNDWIPGYTNMKRASRSSIEHQEFQIRQTVANLRIRENGSKRPLTVTEQSTIVDHLLTVTSSQEAPTWRDLADELLHIPVNSLVTAESDHSTGAVAPILRSVASIHSLPKKHPIRLWWDEAPEHERRDFIRWYADPVKLKDPAPIESVIEPVLESLTDKQMDALLKLSFPTGRSPHCATVLELMNAEIERTGKTYIEVRNYLFGEEGENVSPKPTTLDVKADHPTLQRILPPMRRFLDAMVSEHGTPERVVIEHVRGAFLGFQARDAAISEQRKNQRDRERAAEHLRNAYGITEPKGEAIKRVQAFERQGSRCLYCGAAPGFSAIELDHIVSRKTGGNSTRANLVAVCRPCNAAKGKRTFVDFAESSTNPNITLEAALQRVDELETGQLDRRAFNRLKREMKRRLKQTEKDEPIDERSLASTAYAAVDVRERIQGSLDLGPGSVPVYSGRIIQAARRASRVDEKIKIREGIHAKSRFDRRHHAIDAAIAAMLNPSVARTLAERDDLRRAEIDSGQGSREWTTYEGSGDTAIKKFRKWISDMATLATLIHQEIEDDEIVVTFPVRFSPHHAALHEDGRAPHKTKAVGDSWSKIERSRIVDGRVDVALSTDAKPSIALPEDPLRTLTLPSGKVLSAQELVYIYPDAKARMPLSNFSSSALGQSMHHVRLFRWKAANGSYSSGVVRVWSADLYELADGVKGDLLTSPLVWTSQALRRADTRLRDAIHSGLAEHVGTFVIGDEVFVNPSEWIGANKTGQFFEEWPETHWRLTGWEEPGRANLRPMLLSDEGVRKYPSDTSDRLVEVSKIVQDVLKGSLRITASKLWTTPSTQIIRRTASGSPRWSGESGLPTSWSPFESVNGA